MLQKKKLSYNIERVDTEIHIPLRCHYVYNFTNNQMLENIDKFMDIEHNEIKQNVIEDLVSEFRIALNNVVFGDPAGREYVEELQQTEDFVEVKSLYSSTMYKDWTKVSRFLSLGLQGVEVREIIK